MLGAWLNLLGVHGRNVRDCMVKCISTGDIHNLKCLGTSLVYNFEYVVKANLLGFHGTLHELVVSFEGIQIVLSDYSGSRSTV